MTKDQLDEIFGTPATPPTLSGGLAICIDRDSVPAYLDPVSRILGGRASVVAPSARFTPPAAVQQKKCSLHPKNVIFNPPATIVEWEDGTKTVVKCHDDEFSEEFGYAMAVMRKIYGSRKNFMAQFKDAYRPYLKPKKTKNKAEDQAGDGVQS